ncbi:MAG TPA: chaperone modulator CbpM [Usitatibacter sp.]|nr:chaperone modulator CbpM [Usitatibacter sp.]
MADEYDAVWLEAHARVTLVELARCSGFPEAMLRELVEYGALAPTEGESFPGDCVGRLRRAARLREDLELETEAVALVLRFLERLDSLEGELRYLHAQVPAPRR